MTTPPDGPPDRQLVDAADLARAQADIGQVNSRVTDLGKDMRKIGGEVDRKLIDLGTDVRKARGETASLKAVVVDLASTVSEWAPMLTDAQNDLAELRGTVEELATGQAEVDNPPVDWFALPAETAELEWPKLGQWVHDVLGGWYLVTRGQLPDCWALHRPAMLQVAWLRSSHVEAYLSRSHPSQAAEWNTRWLEAALARIKEYIPDSRCRAVAGGPGEHLVDRLDAQQSRVRGADQMRHQAADLRQQVGQPAGGSSPYPNPYAQQAPATAPAPPAPAAGAGRPAVSAAASDVISWDYWGQYFRQAVAADVAWRRQREAQQPAADR